MPQGRLQPKMQQKPAVSWVPYLLAGVIIGVTLILWYVIRQQSNIHIQHILKLQTDHVAADIKEEVDKKVFTLKHIAHHIGEHPHYSQKDWNEDISRYIEKSDGIVAIAWLSPTFNVRWQTSELTTETTHLLYQSLTHEFSTEIKKTAELKSIWMSPAISYHQNKLGFFIITPIFTSQGKIEGFLISFLNLKSFFENIPLGNSYSVTVFDHRQIIFEHLPSSMQVLNPWLYSVSLNLYGEQWQIDLRPSLELISSLETPLPWLVLFLGIVLTIIFTRMMHLAQLTQHRSKILEEINDDLEREIAERIQAEEGKQKLERALLQGQKLQAIGTLAGGIAHDFNNIIYAIHGYTEMAREDTPHNTVTYSNLGKVLEATNRAKELVSRILAFSRRQHYEFKALWLKETIENVLSLLKPTIPASVALNFITRISDCIISGNETQLHQVMVNIINNAVDAMDGEGTITIELNHVRPGDEILKQFPNISDKSYCRIDISDTGHGMEHNVLERIFEPFFTTKEVGKGTGLGLATAHAIIKEHQGEITVTSRLGHGTTFTILLPEFQAPMTEKGEI